MTARSPQLRIRAEMEGFTTATEDTTIGRDRQAIVMTLVPLVAQASPAKAIKHPARKADPILSADDGEP